MWRALSPRLRRALPPSPASISPPTGWMNALPSSTYFRSLGSSDMAGGGGGGAAGAEGGERSKGGGAGP